MSDTKIAGRYVEFSERGTEKVKKSLAELKANLDAIANTANRVGGAMQRSFAVAAATVGGFATAGLAGTVQGERMRLMFQLLTQQIAGVFVPTIQRLTDILSHLTNWFRNLSGAQQRALEGFTKFGLAALFIGAVVPKVIAGISIALKGLAADAAVLDILTGGILPAIGALVTLAVGLGAFFALSAKGQSMMEPLAAAFNKIFKAVAPLVDVISGQMSEAFTQIMGDLAPLIDMLANLAIEVVPLLIAAFRVFAATGVQNLRITIILLTNALKPLITSLMVIAKLMGIAANWAGFDLNVGGGADKKRTDVTPGSPQYENPADAYKRVQMAILKQSEGKEQLDELKKANGHLAVIAGGAANPVPAVGD